jgi:hypothetical protein
LRLSRILYSAARTANDVEAVEAAVGGHPKRLERRLRNRLKARVLARFGFWRWLWR